MAIFNCYVSSPEGILDTIIITTIWIILDTMVILWLFLWNHSYNPNYYIIYWFRRQWVGTKRHRKKKHMTWLGIFIPSSQVEGFCYILLMSMYFKHPMYILLKKKLQRLWKTDLLDVLLGVDLCQALATSCADSIDLLNPNPQVPEMRCVPVV